MEFNLQNKDQFCWLQLVNSIPDMCKKCIKKPSENTSLLVVKDHHLLRGSRIIILEKLSSKELYTLLIFVINYQPTSQKYFDNLFSNVELLWKEIYLNARKATATVTYVPSIIKLLIMFFIWMRSFFSLVSFVFFLS